MYGFFGVNCNFIRFLEGIGVLVGYFFFVFFISFLSDNYLDKCVILCFFLLVVVIFFIIEYKCLKKMLYCLVSLFVLRCFKLVNRFFFFRNIR